jgi:hypothetical protein
MRHQPLTQALHTLTFPPFCFAVEQWRFDLLQHQIELDVVFRGQQGKAGDLGTQAAQFYITQHVCLHFPPSSTGRSVTMASASSLVLRLLHIHSLFGCLDVVLCVNEPSSSLRKLVLVHGDDALHEVGVVKHACTQRQHAESE